LNQGIPANFVAELASTDPFKQVTKLSDKRMQDKEFVTRFITFYLNKPEEYKPDLDIFMSNAMGKLNGIPSHERDAIRQNFIASMRLSNEIFGKWAFRKVYNKEEKRLYPINKALFEVWSISLAKLSEADRQIIVKAKEDVFNDYVKLINEDSDFVGAITSQTDNRNKIIYRFSKINQLINNRLS
jgi:hypothetical protein